MSTRSRNSLTVRLLDRLKVGMRQKGHIFGAFVILVFLLSVSTITKATESKDDFNRCDHIVKQWASSSLDLEVKEDKHVLQNLLFFLHVPRTGGRTYFHCFLKKLYASSLECPRSYDKLRIDPRKPKCRLLVTHDDYSMMSKLPKDETSVVTILRNPIDRVFSAYEFSVEVAARFLVHPNLTSATKMSGRLRTKNTISTLDIWPWKHLVPWMREDLFARREARKQNGHSVVTSTNPYDTKEIVMPLHEYINNPIAQDILHNGATFQVAGLTNNSYLTEAHDVRHCVLKYQSLGDYVLKVAKKRLDDMLYVGLTENHKESATMFANVVGAQVISQFTGSGSHGDHAVKNHSEQGSSMLETDFDTTYNQSNSSDQKADQISSTEQGEATKENMTAGKLMDAYESCISNLRKTQSERRVTSLKKIYPANFTKEGRRQVSEALLQEITSLNHLDVELYKYAQTIFANQHKRMLLNKVVTKMTMVEHGGYMDGTPTGPIIDDDFDDILNFLDFPMESLEEDGVGVEWDASESNFLGPIPTDALMGFPPMPQGGNIRDGDRVNAVANSRPPIKFTEVQGTGTFQTHSPVSVLEGSNSCSGGKSIPIKHDPVIPVRPRSKRARPSAVNPWVLMAPISSTRLASKKISDARKGKEKKRRLSLLSGAKESTKYYDVQQINDTVPQIPDVSKKKITSTQQPSFVKKCTHCEVTKTPQWREGPLGPKTLCNACGVRYRSGRLFPEYRPAASPTFVPSVHSNSHRKVVEMRKRSIYGATAELEESHNAIIGRKSEAALPEPTIVAADPSMSPAPEFVPMSSYLFDVY